MKNVNNCLNKRLIKSIIIVGKTNVGKSTFLNILKQKNISIVNELPGSTRDYILCLANIFNQEYKIIDTPGIDIKLKKVILEDKITRTIKLIKKADFIFFIIDGRKNISRDDFFISKIILKTNKRVFLLINQTEAKVLLVKISIKRLSIGKGIFISSKHQIGIYNIYLRIKKILKIKSEVKQKKKNSLSIALVGKTNVGKSSFFNSILGFKRNIISKNSDTTRDFIQTNINFKNISINLFDTAGIKNNIESNLEKFSIDRSIYLINKSSIVVTVISSENVIDRQELILIRLIVRKNKLLILLINKKDLIQNIKIFKKKVNFIINKKISYIEDIFIFFSFQNVNIKRNFFLKKVILLWKKYNLKVEKNKLNIIIKKINIKNKNVKVLNIIQHKIIPLTFLFVTNKIKSGIHKKLEKMYINIIKRIFKLNHLYVRVNFIQK